MNGPPCSFGELVPRVSLVGKPFGSWRFVEKPGKDGAIGRRKSRFELPFLGGDGGKGGGGDDDFSSDFNGFACFTLVCVCVCVCVCVWCVYFTPEEL